MHTQLLSFRMINIKPLFILLLSFSFFNILDAQSEDTAKTEVQIAHDIKGKIEEFTATQNGLFQAKLYSVEKASTNKTHHWFLQVIDEKDQFVNISTITLDAYHENDKTTKLNYVGPVFAMCQEGKYVIGFVDIKQSGKWILDITIEQFGKTDTITLDMQVSDN